MDLENLVWIKHPDSINNNFGIEVYCDDCRKVQRFIRDVRAAFPTKEFQWFHQGGHDENSNWAYFEFWVDINSKEKFDDLVRRGAAMAADLNLPFSALGMRRTDAIPDFSERSRFSR